MMDMPKLRCCPTDCAQPQLACPVSGAALLCMPMHSRLLLHPHPCSGEARELLKCVVVRHCSLSCVPRLPLPSASTNGHRHTQVSASTAVRTVPTEAPLQWAPLTRRTHRRRGCSGCLGTPTTAASSSAAAAKAEAIVQCGWCRLPRCGAMHAQHQLHTLCTHHRSCQCTRPSFQRTPASTSASAAESCPACCGAHWSSRTCTSMPFTAATTSTMCFCRRAATTLHPLSATPTRCGHTWTPSHWPRLQAVLKQLCRNPLGTGAH